MTKITTALSKIVNCETLFKLFVVVKNKQIIAGTLALPVPRSGTKLENTSLSTDGDRVPAYILFIFHN